MCWAAFKWQPCFPWKRYIDIKQELDWEISASLGEQELPGRGGSAEVEADNWDAIVGVRGRVPLFVSERWFLPFYVDGGAGDSDFTWQAATGLGYAMERWHFGLVWRHLDYDLESGAAPLNARESTFSPGLDNGRIALHKYDVGRDVLFANHEFS